MSETKNHEQNNSYMEQRRQILNPNTTFAVQEAYKSLRTNINFATCDLKCKRICLTSGISGEGKSITLLNLAISIGQTGKKVLLIDADMRRPTVARLLMEQATPGLSEYLANEASQEEVIRKEMHPNVDVIFSGELPPNPSELLTNERMQMLIQTNMENYDYILVDTPPVGAVTDACIVANLMDGVLLLVWQNRSHRDVVKKAVHSLQLTGANILGYVFNGVMPEKKKYYRYYY